MRPLCDSRATCSLPHLHSTPPLGGFPSEYCHDVWCGKTTMVTWLPDGENIFKICLLLAACPAGSMPASIVFTCVYSVVQKCFLRPSRATHCPDRREIWNGEVDHRSMVHPNAKFHVYRGKSRTYLWADNFLSATVKELLKSDNICESYAQMNKNLAIANRSRVSCTQYVDSSRASTCIGLIIP